MIHQVLQSQYHKWIMLLVATVGHRQYDIILHHIVSLGMFSNEVSSTDELVLLETTPITAESMPRPDSVIEVSPDITWKSHDLALDDVHPDVLELLQCIHGNSSCVQTLVKILQQLSENNLSTLTRGILQVQ